MQQTISQTNQTSVVHHKHRRNTNTYLDAAFASLPFEPSSAISTDTSCEIGIDGVRAVCELGKGAAGASVSNFNFCPFDLSLDPVPLLALTVKFLHLSYWYQPYQREHINTVRSNSGSKIGEWNIFTIYKHFSHLKCKH